MFRAARGARRRLSACEGEVRRGHDGAELHSGRRGDDTVSFLDWPPQAPPPAATGAGPWRGHAFTRPQAPLVLSLRRLAGRAPCYNLYTFHALDHLFRTHSPPSTPAPGAPPPPSPSSSTGTRSPTGAVRGTETVGVVPPPGEEGPGPGVGATAPTPPWEGAKFFFVGEPVGREERSGRAGKGIRLGTHGCETSIPRPTNRDPVTGPASWQNRGPAPETEDPSSLPNPHPPCYVTKGHREFHIMPLWNLDQPHTENRRNGGELRITWTSQPHPPSSHCSPITPVGLQWVLLWVGNEKIVITFI